MADNPQTKVEKLIKYGNEKFGLSETTLRGILNNASAGGGSQPSTDEWQPNPTWWDIETILANDTRDYAYKTILLMYANDVVEDVLDFTGDAYATSDGAFYELGSAGSVSHNWDLSKDKPCIVNGMELYKTRYVIVYTKNLTATYTYKNNIIFMITNEGLGNGNKYIDIPAMQAFKCLGDNVNVAAGLKMFSGAYSLEYMLLPDTSNVTTFNEGFRNCASLKAGPNINTSACTDMGYAFSGCSSIAVLPLYDTSKCTTIAYMCHNCYTLRHVPLWNTSNVRIFNGAFYYCSNIKYLPAIDISSATSTTEMLYRCSKLKTIELLDMRNVTSAQNMFSYCGSLKNITLKNIKVSISLSNSSLLTLDSLLNTIKELRDNTNNALGGTRTLTVGSANLTKLANVYIKLIDITDEMRAEDEFIDNKKPFVVCESTDAGAMLITEYATSKNWQLA